MKKYIFLPAVAALALGFTACDDEDSLGIPVVNPEIPAVDASLVAVAPSADMPAVISLEQYNNDETNFPVATVTTGEDWPAGYGFGAVAQLSTDENFTNPIDITAYTNGKTILLNPDEVQGYVYENVTRDPSELTLWVRFGLQAVNGKEVIRLGNANTFIGAQPIKVLPFSPAAVIEPVYYLIWSDDAETWTKEHSVAFQKGSKSQYDDPNFTLVAELPVDSYWKIIPESTYDTFDLENGLVIGVTEEDSESRSGKLDESENQLAGYLDLGGRVMFEVKLDRVAAAGGDDNAMTFSYKQAIENFWLAGDNVNGLSWSFAAEPTMWTNNYTDYVGMAVLGKEFKFAPQAGWSDDFGSDKGLEFNTTEGGELIGKGLATGKGNINVAEPGLYYIALNYLSKDLTLTKLASWGIIGGFNGWGGSVEMTKVDDFTYTVTQGMNEGDEWKFRANDQWSVSLGGSFDNLDPFNGKNFVCGETGTYDITLNIRNIPWTAVVVKK